MPCTSFRSITATNDAAKIPIPPNCYNSPPFFLLSSFPLHRVFSNSLYRTLLSWPPLPVLGVLSHGRRQTVRRLGPPLVLTLSSLYYILLLLLLYLPTPPQKPHPDIYPFDFSFLHLKIRSSCLPQVSQYDPQ